MRSDKLTLAARTAFAEFDKFVPISKITRSHLVDGALAIAVGLVYASFSFYLYRQINFDLMCRTWDLWFDGDPVRIVSGISSRLDKFHERSTMHPLWSLLVATPFIAVTKLLGLKFSVALYVLVQSFTLGAIFYAVLRVFRIGRFDAVLVSLLLLSTASSWIWLGMPETFALGAVTMLIPVIWLAVPRGAHDSWSAVAQSAISLTVTISNWSAGILAVLIAFGWRRCFVVSSVAFSIVAMLTVLQYRVYPEAGRFFDIWPVDNFYGVHGTLWQHTETFFLKSLAAAPPDLITPALDHSGKGQFSRMQFASPSTEPAAILYILIWVGLVGLGIKAVREGNVALKPALLVGSMIAFNFVIHIFFGVETVLYSLHFVPFFAIVASWALLGGWRPHLVRLAVVAAIGLGVMHNGATFNNVVTWFNALPMSVFMQKPGGQC